MSTMKQIQRRIVRASTRVHDRALALSLEPDRGDVPGWVLITLMTAGLVTGLWMVAGPALTGIFTDAVTSVTGP